MNKPFHKLQDNNNKFPDTVMKTAICTVIIKIRIKEAAIKIQHHLVIAITASLTV
jgi:hypothetical protein